MLANGYSFNIIMIDDGSTDASWSIVRKLQKEHPEVEGIRFQRNYGKSAALQVGFQHAEGEVVLTMDADLQDRPQHIPEFYKMIMEEGYDLVSGWKQKRKDPLSKTIPTKIYNGVNRMISGIKLHDMNCGFKAYRKKVVKSIEVYGDMHRYIPVIAKSAGFTRIGELKVEHIARKYGKSKFGMNRFINGPLDLLTITVLGRYMKRPMHFFGFWGIIFTLIGGGFLGWLFIAKLGEMLNLGFGGPLGERIPAMFFGTVAFLLGVILFITGLIAELIGRTAPGRNEYNIAEYVGTDKEAAHVS